MIELEEREELIKLFDNYSSLLTDKQKQYFEAYYFDDWTLAEIALEYDISRNAVFDQIKKTAAILKHYEECLHQVSHLSKLKESLDKNDLDDIKKTIQQIIEE